MYGRLDSIVSGQLLAEFCREAFDDEGVGMVDEIGDEICGEGAVEDEGVPVFFIHVVAGKDGVVFVAEFERTFGVAFEIHAAFLVVESESGEHFSEDFINEDFGTEGGFFGDFVHGEHVGAAVVDGEFHWQVVA